VYAIPTGVIFPVQSRERGVVLNTLCLARNIDEGLFEKPVSELGIQLLKENPSTGAEKAMTQRGPIRRFTVAT
jgi:hypothetical protein